MLGTILRNNKVGLSVLVVFVLLLVSGVWTYAVNNDPALVFVEGSSKSTLKTVEEATKIYDAAKERDDGTPLRQLERGKAALDLVLWHKREDLRGEAVAIITSYTPPASFENKEAKEVQEEKALANNLSSMLLSDQPLPYPVEDGQHGATTEVASSEQTKPTN